MGQASQYETICDTLFYFPGNTYRDLSIPSKQ